MSTTQHLRSATAALPRFSLASVMLALALAAMLSAAVGIAAWTISSPSGVSAADVASARKSAYDQGYSAGKADGVTAGKKTGTTAGFARGRKAGYSAGFLRGRRIGYQRGKTAGYASGFSAGQASVPTTTTHKKKKGN